MLLPCSFLIVQDKEVGTEILSVKMLAVYFELYLIYGISHLLWKKLINSVVQHGYQSFRFCCYIILAYLPCVFHAIPYNVVHHIYSRVQFLGSSFHTRHNQL
jgi:hypothetical protein